MFQAIDPYKVSIVFVTLRYGKPYVEVRRGLRSSTEIFLWSTGNLTLKYERKRSGSGPGNPVLED
jgi:hypothetical protein